MNQTIEAQVAASVAAFEQAVAKIRNTSTIAVPSPEVTIGVKGSAGPADSLTTKPAGKDSSATGDPRAGEVGGENDPLQVFEQKLDGLLGGLERLKIRSAVSQHTFDDGDSALTLLESKGGRVTIGDDGEAIVRLADGREIVLSSDALVAGGVDPRVLRAAGISGTGSHGSAVAGTAEPTAEQLLASQATYDRTPRSVRNRLLKGKHD